VKQPTLWYRFCKWLIREILWRATGGLRILNRDRFPKEGPVLVAPVHVSNFDPFMVGVCTPRPLSFMAKKELFEHWFVRRLIRSFQAFPVERGIGDTAAIRLALEILREGSCLLVFPEGTRGDGVSFNEIKPGIAMLAKKSGAKVLPVGIHGTHKMFPRDGGKFRRTRVTVAFGEPIDYFEVEAAGDPGTARERFTRLVIEGLDRACREAGLELKPFQPSEETSAPV
jgi:1-acyl-sn-glycerol-3-phosphate acyltransferase